MKIKRFHAADVRQAMNQVREMLGPDAVILSNNRVDGGIEIVAATDYDERQFTAKASSSPSPKPQKNTKVEINPAHSVQTDITPSTTKRAPEQNVWSQEPTLVQMRKEISGIREMLQSQLSDLAWKEMERVNPTQVQLLHRYLSMGINVDLAKKMVSQSHHHQDVETAWRHSLGVLARRLPVEDENFLESGGVYALVGSTGAGKTTTIAKMAARYALKFGAKHVGLITSDCFRVGGQDQLRAYARILGVPIRSAKNEQELNAAIDELLDRRLILVDTAGMNHRDKQLNQKIALLRNQSNRMKVYLTLPAVAQTNVINDTINGFSHLQLSGCILTKIDEANSLGGAISAMIDKQLPLGYTCNGQQVPEDLSVARPATLIKEASLMNEQHQLDPQTLSSYGGFAAYG